MRLKQLLNGIIQYSSQGLPDLEIKGLTYDSRQVKPGFLFVAIKGFAMDGHAFIMDAVKNGAVAVVGEFFQGEKNEYEDIPLIHVSDSRKALSRIAARSIH